MPALARSAGQRCATAKRAPLGRSFQPIDATPAARLRRAARSGLSKKTPLNSVKGHAREARMTVFSRLKCAAFQAAASGGSGRLELLLLRSDRPQALGESGPGPGLELLVP